MFHGGRGPRRHTRGQPGTCSEGRRRGHQEKLPGTRNDRGLEQGGLGTDTCPKVARSDRNKTGVGSDPALCLSGDVGFDSCSGFREIMGGGGRLWGTAARELTGARCRCVPAHSGPSPRGRGFC